MKSNANSLLSCITGIHNPSQQGGTTINPVQSTTTANIQKPSNPKMGTTEEHIQVVVIFIMHSEKSLCLIGV